MSSNGMVLATAMAAVSGTVLLLAFHLQKPPSDATAAATQFSIIHHPRPCISSDGKKRIKKNKKVHFAEDVMEPSGNGEEFRKRLQSKSIVQNRTFSSNLKSEGSKKRIVRNYEGIPANRMALYAGMLRDRSVHRERDRVTTYRLDSVDWGKFGLPVYVVNRACRVEVIRILAGQPPISSLPPFMVGGAVDWCVMMSSLDASLSVPLFRRPLFNAPEFTWSIDYSTFGDGFHYFFYILRKILESDTFYVPSLGSSVGLKPSLEYMSIELAGVDRPGLYRLLMFQAMHLVSQVMEQFIHLIQQPISA
ncbi:hypothetical protein Tco_1417693 [Tanacetum coccineum]